MEGHSICPLPEKKQSVSRRVRPSSGIPVGHEILYSQNQRTCDDMTKDMTEVR